MDQRNLCVLFMDGSLPHGEGFWVDLTCESSVKQADFSLRVAPVGGSSLRGEGAGLTDRFRVLGGEAREFDREDKSEALRQVILTAFERGFELLVVVFPVAPAVAAQEVSEALTGLHAGAQVIVAPSRRGTCRFLALDGVYLEAVRDIPWGTELEVSTVEARAAEFDLHVISHGLRA